MAEDETGQFVRRLLLEGRDHVAVGVEGHGDGRMAKTVGHHLWVGPGGESDGRVGMAKVVDAQGCEACTSGKAAELPGERIGSTGVPFSRQNTNPWSS